MVKRKRGVVTVSLFSHTYMKHVEDGFVDLTPHDNKLDHFPDYLLEMHLRNASLPPSPWASTPATKVTTQLAGILLKVGKIVIGR